NRLVGAIRLEGARGVVQEHSGCAEVRKLLGLLDELFRLSAPAGTVDQSRIELPVGRRDRLACLTQVRDVVERILEAEDVDPALGRARDETAREVAAHGTRADEEAAAQSHSERSLRPRLERANPLPRALDAAAHGGVEHASAGDLEVREPRAVEQL